MLLTGILILIIINSLTNYTKTEIKQISILSIILLIYVVILGYNAFEALDYTISITLYNEMLQCTPINIIISILLLIIGIIYFIIYIEYIEYNENIRYYKEYTLLILVNILGMILFINSNNFIVFFITIELQSYTLYVITTIYALPNTGQQKYMPAHTDKHIRLGLIYFLLGSFASIIILLGLSIIYSNLNVISLNEFMGYMFNIWDPNESLSDIYNIQIIIGTLLMISGLLYKIGAAPLHNWVIDIYNNSPTIVTLWISLVTKISIFTVLYSIFFSILYIYKDIDSINNIIYTIAILCMIVGSLGGLTQIGIKYILIYSGIANLGFILYSLFSLNEYTLIAFLFNIIQYSITHILIFIIILTIMIYYTKWLIVQHYDNKNNIKHNSNILYNINMYQLIGLIKCNPTLIICLIICLASFIGIPPLAGFYGKFFLLEAGLRSGAWLGALVLITTSIISTLYYAYIISTITYNYMKTSAYIKYNNMYKNNTNTLTGPSSLISYTISILTIMILFPQLILDIYLNGLYIIEYGLIY